MLPFDNRPWARSLARAVIAASIVAAIAGAYYLYSMEELHIPEVTGIVLLLLTIVPPNVAIVLRRREDGGESSSLGSPNLGAR